MSKEDYSIMKASSAIPFVCNPYIVQGTPYYDGALAQDYARQGKAFIVAPDDTCGVDTLKKDKESLHRLYENSDSVPHYAGRQELHQLGRF